MKNSFCLKSVVSSRQINLSPLNRSTSKNLWSFGKDSRFKKPLVYCDKIYEHDSKLSKRKSGIGYGKKSDFTKDLTCSPGSSKYHLKTIFDKNRSSKKGFSMYVNREQIPDKGYIPLEPLKVPAANKYNNLKLDIGSRYSMRKKTNVIDKTMSIESQNKNPGAGTYENPQALSSRGNYQVSKHRGTGATLFNPRRSVRFFEFRNNNPGPGRYEQINNLSNSGKYLNSRSTGYGKRYFDKETRVVEFEKKATKNYYPGPGSYRSPSDFGQYDGEVYNSTLLKTLSANSRKSLGGLNETIRSSRRKG